MSKVRDLPSITTLTDDDLLYVVDESAGPNGGRKIKKSDLKTNVLPTAAETKTLYESNPDTNAFTDAEKAKLATVEANAAFQDADEVPYNNTVSGLAATDVQEAIDEVNTKAQADFIPSIVSGRILHYSGGTARFDGVFYSVLAGNILLNPNVTLGEVYVDLDGLVKQTGSGIDAPPYTIVFAKFSTDLNNIISLTDERVKNAQNIIRGLVSDVRDVRAGAAAAEGTSGRVSDAMHKHNILTGAPSTVIPDTANAEGVSVNLARADHNHNIATATPSTVGTANSIGVSNAFSRADHVHDHGSLPGGNTHALATDSVAGFMSATDKVTVDLLREIQTVTNEPTGFPNRTDSAISFINGTRTFTIQPTGTSFDYWIAGEKFTISIPKNIQIGTSTGLHFIWFDNTGNLQTSFGPPFSDVFVQPIAFIAVIYWNNTAGELITLGDERHGMTMDGASHRLVNNAFGAIFNDGLAINSFSIDGDGSTNAQTQFSVANGSFFDEDILFEITNNSPQPLQPAQLPILYKLGPNGDWYKKPANTLPLIYSGTAGYTGANGRIPFNEFDGLNWVLTEASENNYVWIHVIVVNDTTNHVIGVQGIHQYVTVQAARNDLEAELSHLGTLAAREQIVIGSILYKTSAAYTNTAKAVTSSVLGSNYVDFRKVLVQVAGAANDHSSLANLQADTHSQYLNRSGVRPMTGNLDMGTNNITNVGLVDGVDVFAHASRHLPSGADPIATGAPTTTLSPAISNAEGAGVSFARNDHTHAIATALVGDITTIQPDDAASAGTANTYARGDHRHAIVAAAPSTQNADQANAEGASTSFARADHVHNIPTATPVATGTANSQGIATTFAKSDHVHNTVLSSTPLATDVSDTTTSATDVLIAGMSLTPASGTYFVMFSSSTVNSGNGAERNFVSLYSAGSQVSGTERRVGIAGGATVPVATQAVVTVNGSQAIEARWRVTAGTGTMYQRRMTFIKIG